MASILNDKELITNKNIPNLYLWLDDNVHKTYAKEILPLAVAYTASLLDYFFRGEMEISRGEEDNIKIKNLSGEEMNGKFTFYYDAIDGTRQPVPGGAWELSLLSMGTKNDTSPALRLPEPQDIHPKENYILVFEGTFGNEKTAVVGKVWERNPPGEVIIFHLKDGEPSIGIGDKSLLGAGQNQGAPPRKLMVYNASKLGMNLGSAKLPIVAKRFPNYRGLGKEENVGPIWFIRMPFEFQGDRKLGHSFFEISARSVHKDYLYEEKTGQFYYIQDSYSLDYPFNAGGTYIYVRDGLFLKAYLFDFEKKEVRLYMDRYITSEMGEVDFIDEEGNYYWVADTIFLDGQIAGGLMTWPSHAAIHGVVDDYTYKLYDSGSSPLWVYGMWLGAAPSIYPCRDSIGPRWDQARRNNRGNLVSRIKKRNIFTGMINVHQDYNMKYQAGNITFAETPYSGMDWEGKLKNRVHEDLSMQGFQSISWHHYRNCLTGLGAGNSFVLFPYEDYFNIDYGNADEFHFDCAVDSLPHESILASEVDTEPFGGAAPFGEKGPWGYRQTYQGNLLNRYQEIRRTLGLEYVSTQTSHLVDSGIRIHLHWVRPWYGATAYSFGGSGAERGWPYSHSHSESIKTEENDIDASVLKWPYGSSPFYTIKREQWISTYDRRLSVFSGSDPTQPGWWAKFPGSRDGRSVGDPQPIENVETFINDPIDPVFYLVTPYGYESIEESSYEHLRGWAFLEGQSVLVQGLTSDDFSLHRLWSSGNRIDETLAAKVGVPISDILGVIFLPNFVGNEKD